MGTSMSLSLRRTTAASSDGSSVPSIVRPSLSSTRSKAMAGAAATSVAASAPAKSLMLVPPRSGSELLHVLQPRVLELLPVGGGPVLEGQVVRDVLHVALDQ